MMTHGKEKWNYKGREVAGIHNGRMLILILKWDYFQGGKKISG